MSGSTTPSYGLLTPYIQIPQLQGDGSFLSPGQIGYVDLNQGLNQSPSVQPPAPPPSSGGGSSSIVVEAPISGGSTELDAQPTQQDAGSIPITNLTVQSMPLTFIPNPGDPNSGTLLVPGGDGALYQVPANTAGAVGAGSYAPVLPDTQMGVFNIQNEAAQKTPGFDISAGALVGALATTLGTAVNLAGGGTAGGAATAVTTLILGNLAAQGTVHVPYVAPGYNPDTAFGFGPQ